MADVFQSAVEAHRAGRLDEARKLYRTAIARSPGNAHAHYLLGCLLMDRKEFPPARECMEKALKLCPSNPSYLCAIGALHTRSGDSAGAVPWFEKAVRLSHAHEDSFRGLGYAYAATGRHSDAIRAFRKGIERFGPGLPLIKGLVESASFIKDIGTLRETIEVLHRGDAKARELAAQLEFRTAALVADNAGALEIALKWLEKEPESVPALNACAEASFSNGNHLDCVAYCAKVLERDPGNADATLIIFGALSKLERFTEAARYGRLAMRLVPERLSLAASLSFALFKTSSKEGHYNDIEDACYYASMVMQERAGDFSACSAMSSILLNMLRMREGMTYFDRAHKAAPKNTGNISSRLFHDNYAWFYTREERFERHLEWGRAVRESVGEPRTAFDNVPDPEKPLRLGFVSADFFYHPVSYFFFSVFQQLRKTHEICIYSHCKESDEDEMTQSYRKDAFLFRNIYEMKDAEFQDQVVEDGVDVIFDLSGHTSGH
ncbi:MAG TPA: tetratricopeptide repeat protein, partial [Opitutales bacterium]|nr:tetratricopeptide repeat protein [Opitutales bacterium]